MNLISAAQPLKDFFRLALIFKTDDKWLETIKLRAKSPDYRPSHAREDLKHIAAPEAKKAAYKTMLTSAWLKALKDQKPERVRAGLDSLITNYPATDSAWDHVKFVRMASIAPYMRDVMQAHPPVKSYLLAHYRFHKARTVPKSAQGHKKAETPPAPSA